VDVQLLLDEDLGGWRVGASEGPPGRGSLGCVAGGAMGATTSYQGDTAPWQHPYQPVRRACVGWRSAGLLVVNTHRQCRGMLTSSGKSLGCGDVNLTLI